MCAHKLWKGCSSVSERALCCCQKKGGRKKRREPEKEDTPPFFSPLLAASPQPSRVLPQKYMAIPINRRADQVLSSVGRHTQALLLRAEGVFSFSIKEGKKIGRLSRDRERQQTPQSVRVCVTKTDDRQPLFSSSFILCTPANFKVACRRACAQQSLLQNQRDTSDPSPRPRSASAGRAGLSQNLFQKNLVPSFFFRLCCFLASARHACSFAIAPTHTHTRTCARPSPHTLSFVRQLRPFQGAS